MDVFKETNTSVREQAGTETAVLINDRLLGCREIDHKRSLQGGFSNNKINSVTLPDAPSPKRTNFN